LIALGTLMPWITVSWLSGGSTSYYAFNSEVLGAWPGISMLGVAIVLFAIALCDLAILRLKLRILHTTFCVIALATAGTLDIFAQFFESRDAGGQGFNVAAVSWASGSWIVLSGVLIGFLGIAVGALAAKASGNLWGPRASSCLELCAE